MGCGASAQPAAQAAEVVEAPKEQPSNQVEAKAEIKAVDSDATTATPPPEGDDEAAKQLKEEEAAALKIQSNHRGKQARKEVAAKKAGQEGPATADADAAPEGEPTSDNAAEPALTEEEKAKQTAEEEAAALKIQSNHRGKQARKEVAAKKAENEGAPADTEAVPKEEPAADNAAEPPLTEEEAAKQKAEEEAAALKIQSNHRGKQARKEVAAMKDSPAAPEAAGETQPDASAPAEGQ